MAPELDDQVVPHINQNNDYFINLMYNFNELNVQQKLTAVSTAVDILNAPASNNAMSCKLAIYTIVTNFVDTTVGMFDDVGQDDKLKFYTWCYMNINTLTLATYTVNDVSNLLLSSTEHLAIKLKTDLPAIHLNLQTAISIVPSFPG